ncbi:MAG: tetratricopeptide repeat protein [Syntrophomonadaceae bacterium]
MKYQTIMKNITAGLTGESDRDLPYLMKMAEKYKSHELAEELLRGIGRLIYELLPEDRKGEWNRRMQDEALGTGEVLEEARFHIFRKDYPQALNLLEGLMAEIEGSERYASDTVNEYYSFSNFLEEILFQELYQPQGEVRYAPENYADIYFIYGNLLLELERFDEAETALRQAARWNPVRADVLYELGEIYKRRKQSQPFYDISVQGLERAYRSEHLTRGYRNLGYYFTEQGDYEMAAALFFFSLGFEPDNQNAQSELMYISQVSGERVAPPTMEQLGELFARHHIQMGPNPLVVEIAISIGNEAGEQGDYDAARYFFSVAYDLTGDERIKKHLDTLPGAD